MFINGVFSISIHLSKSSCIDILAGIEQIIQNQFSHFCSWTTLRNIITSFFFCQHMINPRYISVTHDQLHIIISTEKITNRTPMSLFIIIHLTPIYIVKHHIYRANIRKHISTGIIGVDSVIGIWISNATQATSVTHIICQAVSLPIRSICPGHIIPTQHDILVGKNTVKSPSISLKVQTGFKSCFF